MEDRILVTLLKRMPAPRASSGDECSAGDCANVTGGALEVAGQMLDICKETPSTVVRDAAGRACVFALRCVPAAELEAIAEASGLVERARTMLVRSGWRSCACTLAHTHTCTHTHISASRRRALADLQGCATICDNMHIHKCMCTYLLVSLRIHTHTHTHTHTGRDVDDAQEQSGEPSDVDSSSLPRATHHFSAAP